MGLAVDGTRVAGWEKIRSNGNRSVFGFSACANYGNAVVAKMGYAYGVICVITEPSARNV